MYVNKEKCPGHFNCFLNVCCMKMYTYTCIYLILNNHVYLYLSLP